MPNLLLSGAPGIGKTTSIGCLATELLLQAFPEITDPAAISEMYKESVLELNASDDRGIEVVRNKIKLFAQKKLSFMRPGMHKLIILDEADICEAGQPAGDQQAGGDRSERGGRVRARRHRGAGVHCGRRYAAGDQQPAGNVPRDGPDKCAQCVPDLRRAEPTSDCHDRR
ncbi:Replication factor C subunit 2 [Smittium culicis]|uniref:Replication factor C subunit 2 n=1 Tax=Smittium culicis TaxID=133412 RepID=A0A1R1Y8A5_9FUNG|nr:Replication factor C subunit 2 [Smittium culicis]